MKCRGAGFVVLSASVAYSGNEIKDTIETTVIVKHERVCQRNFARSPFGLKKQKHHESVFVC